jgi:Flp pilus assembly protein TadD
MAAQPTDGAVHFALGAFQQSVGNPSEAEKHLRRALELDPSNAAIQNYLGYSLADRGRELPYAESLIRRALEDDPLSGAFLDSLGWALYKQNRLEEAETALLRAADLQAGDGTVREHLGDLYHRKGDTARALTEWRTAQSLRPEDPERLRKKVQSALKEAARR